MYILLITENRKQELNLIYLLFRQSMALPFHLKKNFMTTNQWAYTQYVNFKCNIDLKFHIIQNFQNIEGTNVHI